VAIDEGRDEEEVRKKPEINSRNNSEIKEEATYEIVIGCINLYL
jgi:hypothetical protein